MFKRFLSYLNHRIFYIWLLVFAFFTVAMSPENSAYYGIVATYLLFFLIYSWNPKVFFYTLLFITISLSLYYPISAYYGPLNSGIIAALFETNFSESLEFLDKFKLSDFGLPLLYIFSFIILIRLSRYNQPQPPQNKKERLKERILYAVLFFAVVLSTVWVPTKYHFQFKNDLDVESDWTLANSPVNLIAFYTSIYASIDDYFSEKAELAAVKDKVPAWKIASVSPKYKNYVLIIGESARKDYLSAYGFGLKTSPFMDTAKGYINAGYISAAPGTYHSLLHSLHYKALTEKGKRDFSYNIVTLAKAAKFNTAWLSNQGTIGKFDTLASRIGHSADFSYFTKTAAYNVGEGDDFQLVDALRQQIKDNAAKPQQQPNLYVLHLMGSHADFCNRLKEDEHSLAFVNKKLSCYVNTLLKTDRLLEKVVSILKESNESFSLIYFSDHGLSHINKEEREEISLEHGTEFKQNYQVPFIKIASDDTERQEVNVRRSAFNFMYGFAQWLGIKTEELNNGYDFFSDKDDENIKVFNFDKYPLFDELKEDKIPQ